MHGLVPHVFSVKRQREGKKKEPGDSSDVIVAVACLPTAVSLLLLEALFMQISRVRLTLTWPCRLCLLRVLLCASHCYKLSSFQAHWGRWHCTCFLRPACLFIAHAHVGGGSSPLSCGVFLLPPLSQAFPLELLEGTFHEKSVEIFKDAMKEYVYGDPEIVKLELAAKKIYIFSLRWFCTCGDLLAGRGKGKIWVV